MNRKGIVFILAAVLFASILQGVSKAAESKIYWLEQGSDKVRCANLDGSNVQDLVTTGLDQPFGIALDVSDDKIYWTDWKTDTIKRANLNGTNIETLLSGLPTPLGIALDIGSGKMYWTDVGVDTIKRANLNGTNIETLLSGLPAPYGIALDIGSGKMYWTDVVAHTIKRANLNGTNVETLVSRLSNPHSVALDIANGKMYWTDFGTDTIKRANLNGTNVETLVSRLADPAGIALDVSDDKMYWTDWKTGRIKRANLNGTNVETILSGLSNPVGIVLGASGGGDLTDDHSNTRAEATFLPLGNSLAGQIEIGNDIDFFRIEASGPGVIKAYTTGSLDTVGYLQNSSGSILAYNDDQAEKNYNFSIQHSVTAGTYYIRVSSYETNTGSYTLHTSFTLDPSAADISLTMPEDLISEVAFGPNSTYFVLNAQYPILIGVDNAEVSYGNCTITLDLEGVPDNSLSEDLLPSLLEYLGQVGIGKTIFEVAKGFAEKAGLLDVFFDEPQYFIFPLQTAAERTLEVQEEAAWGYLGSSISSLVGLLPIVGDIISFGIDWGSTEHSNVLAINEILTSMMDPVIVLDAWGFLQDVVPQWRNPGRPSDEDKYVLILPKRVTEIKIKVEQVYMLESDKGQLHTVPYEGTYNLETNVFSAPSKELMTVSDYPPFQMLPREVQAYLLQHFGEFANAEAWQIPEETALLPNYPNPFNPETWIPYQLAKPVDVTLTIYGIDGQVVRQLALGHQAAGVYRNRSRAAYWDGKNEVGEPVASGLYFYTLTAGEFNATRKMLIAK